MKMGELRADRLTQVWREVLEATGGGASELERGSRLWR